MKYYSESGLPIFYGTKFSAGLDLPFYDPEIEEITVLPGERVKLATGIHAEIPEGTYGKIDPRSSTSKRLLTVLCSTIDCDYRGNIHIVMCNVGKEPQTIKRGEYLAQMVIIPYVKVSVQVAESKDALSDTERGVKGFGSTTKTRV